MPPFRPSIESLPEEIRAQVTELYSWFDNHRQEYSDDQSDFLIHMSQSSEDLQKRMMAHKPEMFTQAIKDKLIALGVKPSIVSGGE